jgi:hypothetical protein
VWKLPSGVPPKVLLRVTVRDKAGNVGTAVTSEKMSVDLVAPEGRLTGVRPQGQGPEPGPMPRDVEAGAADGPIPAVLRSVLPALLNSPGFGPLPGLQHASELSPSKELSAQDYHEWWCRQYEAKLRSLVRAESAKAWVEQLTNTTVAEESPRPMFRRPEPGAVPPIPEMLPDEAERLLAQLHGRVRTLDPAEPGAERGPDLGWTQVPQEGWFRPYERTLLRREWQRTAEATFRTLTRGETVLRLLTDHDWQPSTAKRQRYRWSGPTFADRPFSGTFDAGPGFSGTLPGGGVRLDF